MANYIARTIEARHALGLYADHRLGLRDGNIYNPLEARDLTETVFGRSAANFAVKACDEWEQLQELRKAA